MEFKQQIDATGLYRFYNDANVLWSINANLNKKLFDLVNTRVQWNPDNADHDMRFGKNTTGDWLIFDALADTVDFNSAQNTLTAPADKNLLSAQPSGTVDLAIATTKFVKDNADIAGIAEKTADYTILDTDDNKLIVLGRATSADKTFTLPTLADNLDDTVRVKNMSDYILTVEGESLGTDAVEAGTTTTNITATGHSAVVGCVFEMTSGDESGETRRVSAVVDANNFTLENALSGTPTATETFELFEAIDGEKQKLIGKYEQLNFYGADLTADEWVVVNA